MLDAHTQAINHVWSRQTPSQPQRTHREQIHRRVIIKDNRQRRNRPAQSHTLLSSREPAGSLHATPYPHCGGLAQLGPPARLSCFHQPHFHVRNLAPHRPSVPHLRRCSKLLDVVKVERLGACARATIRRTVVRAGAFGACSHRYRAAIHRYRDHRCSSSVRTSYVGALKSDGWREKESLTGFSRS